MGRAGIGKGQREKGGDERREKGASRTGCGRAKEDGWDGGRAK